MKKVSAWDCCTSAEIRAETCFSVSDLILHAGLELILHPGQKKERKKGKKTEKQVKVLANVSPIMSPNLERRDPYIQGWSEADPGQSANIA